MAGIRVPPGRMSGPRPAVRLVRLMPLIVPLLVAGVVLRPPPADPLTTVILVRHAEKAAAPADDPPLTLEGEARARQLDSTLANAGIDAIYITQWERSIATVEPLLGRLHLTPVMVSTEGSVREHARAIARDIRASHAGEVVLVAGHSNTLPPIIEELGGAVPAAIPDWEYDALYIVTLGSDRPVKTIRARYGPPSAADRPSPM